MNLLGLSFILCVLKLSSGSGLCNNVAPQVARKCCPYHLALILNYGLYNLSVEHSRLSTFLLPVFDGFYGSFSECIEPSGINAMYIYIKLLFQIKWTELAQ